MPELPEKKPQILVVMGVSGAGKSTVGKRLAQAWGWSFIEGDQFHSRANVEKMAAGIALTDSDRADWLKTVKDQMETSLRLGHSAVVACSALKCKYREALRIGNRVQFLLLNISFAEAKQRLLSRKGHFMPASLLASQFESLEVAQGEEKDLINVDAQQSPDQIVREVVAKLQN